MGDVRELNCIEAIDSVANRDAFTNICDKILKEIKDSPYQSNQMSTVTRHITAAKAFLTRKEADLADLDDLQAAATATQKHANAALRALPHPMPARETSGETRRLANSALINRFIRESIRCIES